MPKARTMSNLDDQTMKPKNYSMPSILGAVLCLFAVAIGAFGSHALHDLLLVNQRIDTYELANRYQFYHGLSLLVLGTQFQKSSSVKTINTISYLMVFGVIIFSGSLYLLAITNITWLGAITPIGGVLFILAWLMLIWKLWNAKNINH